MGQPAYTFVTVLTLDPVVQYSAAPTGLGRGGDRGSVEVLDIDEDEAAGGHSVLLVFLFSG